MAETVDAVREKAPGPVWLGAFGFRARDFGCRIELSGFALRVSSNQYYHSTNIIACLAYGYGGVGLQ